MTEGRGAAVVGSPGGHYHESTLQEQIAPTVAFNASLSVLLMPSDTDSEPVRSGTATQPGMVHQFHFKRGTVGKRHDPAH